MLFYFIILEVPIKIFARRLAILTDGFCGFIPSVQVNTRLGLQVSEI
jgi:hypothetical protein